MSCQDHVLSLKSITSSSFSNSLLRLYLVLYFPYSVCGRSTRKAVHSFTPVFNRRLQNEFSALNSNVTALFSLFV